MTKVLKVNVETQGSTKVVYHSCLQNIEVATCKLTWFPLQKTVHVWCRVPFIHSRHSVTLFQKFQGTFQELVQQYLGLFQQITWVLVPVMQGKSSLDMLPYRLEKLTPGLAALVRALLVLKKSDGTERKYGPERNHGSESTKHSTKKNSETACNTTTFCDSSRTDTQCTRTSSNTATSVYCGVDDCGSNPDFAHRSPSVVV
jgi:hypothetical protein